MIKNLVLVKIEKQRIDLFNENADVFDEFNKILMDLEEMAPGVKEFILDNSSLGNMMYNEVGSKVLIAK